ncbi:ABC transporter substrate-binding protein [Parasphaerochaeta coccoides]|uniref:ABC transporter substrate binding protein n=1 Tax=Parasphaerochaeta coccoides (strain ATCC BAA-1237 / DSM 17374 / SPN1) TaxID=760011 RepID=F4GJF1_PARC1|nr:ABC transporter substrate-binding protein [Parasphaerochaeta coccoides]AEC02216.1 ABC transporter substrate binding protein [Parasphaerochaeta coccoides DSM 17374]
MTKKILMAILALFLSASVVLVAGGRTEIRDTAQGVTKIGVAKLLSHPALDAAEQGMTDYLAGQGLNVSIDYQNANGDVATSASIAQKFKSENMDIVVGIATPTAQALANVFTTVPVVFAAVTDPVAASLVSSLDGDATSNVTGVTDSNPVKEQLELFIGLTGAKNVGIIYASGEANSVVLLEAARLAAQEIGFTLVPASVSNSSEVKLAAQSIIDRVDAIYIPTDNTVASAMAAVADVTSRAGKPLMGADPSAVQGLDFLVSWGFNYYNIGIATGKVVEKIIQGTPAGSIPTVFLTDPADFELWFNLDVAARLGITVPRNLLDNAAVTVRDGQIIRK